MKRLIVWAAALLMLLNSAFSEGPFTYTQESVTDCACSKAYYEPFYTAGELSAIVPGLKQSFVPQGVSYIPEKNWLLIAGYSSDSGVNSVLFAIDIETGAMVREVLLQYKDGSTYSGHAGGVAVTEKNIFIANNQHLYRISLEKFLALPDSAYCAFDEEIAVPSRASYCAYADGILWVGEFQYNPDYKTDSSHWYKTEDGRHRAWLIGYELDAAQENELKPTALAAETLTPDYIITTTERIQGMTIRDDEFYLSQSYGRRNSSSLLIFSNVLESDPREYVDLNGAQVPLWSLTSTVQTGTLVLPPMSECLVTVGSDIYVLFESAAETYIDPSDASANPMDRLFRLSGK